MNVTAPRRLTMREAYAAQRKRPEWQKKSHAIMMRDGYICRTCLGRDQHCQVHHLVYTRHRPWLEPDEHLVTLCDPCHVEEEALIERIGNAVRDKAPLIARRIQKAGEVQLAMMADSVRIIELPGSLRAIDHLARALAVLHQASVTLAGHPEVAEALADASARPQEPPKLHWQRQISKVISDKAAVLARRLRYHAEIRLVPAQTRWGGVGLALCSADGAVVEFCPQFSRDYMRTPGGIRIPENERLSVAFRLAAAIQTVWAAREALRPYGMARAELEAEIARLGLISLEAA